MESISARLRAFDATARTGSMSAAARQLGLTQPTVSEHISRLERHFGVELFTRRGRRVELTGFGASLHEVTLRAFRAELEARTLLEEARSLYRGRLQICAVGPYNVMPMIKRYRQRWPAVQIAVSVGDSREIVERVLAYQGDLALPLHPVVDPRIHCVPYRRQRLVVIAPRAHRLAQCGSLELTDLESEEFVMREIGSATRKVFEEGLAASSVKVRTVLEMGSREAVREAVAQGLGLGVVADAAHVPDRRLVVLALAGEGLFTHPHVICLRERKGATLIANFLSVVDECAAESSPKR